MSASNSPLKEFPRTLSSLLSSLPPTDITTLPFFLKGLAVEAVETLKSHGWFFLLRSMALYEVRDGLFLFWHPQFQMALTVIAIANI